ncbi:MAG TPA: hypothetical protein VMW41_01030 [Candidatus Bathyarchaeia archaeon]|nr:hypothetical protein [Candidatus Bathyarchaeia archaeon]
MDILAENILKSVSYADIFDFPLTAEEITRYLISSTKFNRQEVEFTAGSLYPGLLGIHKGYFFLKNRKLIISGRLRRQEFSQRKLALGRKLACLLRIVPWIQAVLLTGNVAWKNADSGDDIDWLIITDKNRLWLSRLFAVLILQLLGIRRRPEDKEVNNKICLNLFLTKDNLVVPESKQDLFTAHEILQAKPLWQRQQVYLDFIRVNAWAQKYLANAYSNIVCRQSRSSLKSRNSLCFKVSGEFFRPLSKIGGWLLDYAEQIVFNWQKKYMSGRRTIETVEVSRAFFHPANIRNWVMAEYRKRLITLKLVRV